MYKTEKNTRSSKLYCSNCGKFGHVYKKCKDPVTSFGVISVKLSIPKMNWYSDKTKGL